MNRPDFCAKLLGQIGDDERPAPYLDTVLVMEQGTQTGRPTPSSSRRAEEALGDQLRVIEQGNLGGSGGYARGQLESVRKGTATYALMMDDDVVCEPEGIIRAVTFGDLARRPTIVGGHMFSLYSPLAAAQLRRDRPAVALLVAVAASTATATGTSRARNLRSARWLHKRVDVDFNGWFMCLIPRVVLEEIGLSLPLFIKWDDSEFGLRAKAAGYPTVTFPGAAVWHVPWTDKNDAVDWQAYFHQRNRFVAALLHSPYARGGRMVRESLNHQIKHLVSMQYSTVELRHLALRGRAAPARTPCTASCRPSSARSTRSASSSPTRSCTPTATTFPPVRRKKPPDARARPTSRSPGRLSTLITAGLAPIRQLRPVRELSQEFPEAELTAMDAKWYRLASYDSAIVSMNDGSLGRALPARPGALPRPAEADDRDPPAASAASGRELAAEYRAALGEITSPEAWDETFAPWTEGEGE